MSYLGLLLLLIVGIVIGLFIMNNGRNTEVGKDIIIIITCLVSLVVFPIVTLIVLGIYFLYKIFYKKRKRL